MAELFQERGLSWSEEFKSLYALVKKSDLGLIAITPDVITSISKELALQETAYRTRNYIFITTGASLNIGFATFLILYCFKFSSLYSQQILHLATHSEIVNWSIAFYAFATFIYCFIQPLLFRCMKLIFHWVILGFKNRKVNSLIRINSQRFHLLWRHKLIRLNVLHVLIYTLYPRFFIRRMSIFYTGFRLLNITFMLYAGIALYILFPIIFSALTLIHPALFDAARIAITIWLIPTCLVLTFFLSMFIAANIFRRFAERPATTQYIALDLMRIIERLSIINHLGTLRHKDRIRIIDAIYTCGYRIQRLYPNCNAPLGSWAREQVNLARNNFLKLATTMYFPQGGSLQPLRCEICEYLNIFLSGNLDELPRKSVSSDGSPTFQSRDISGWRKLILYFIAFIYLGAPLGILFALTFVHSFSIPASATAPLAGLYLVWVVCGAIFFAEKFSPDTRALFAEVLKTYFGRK